VLTFPHDDAAFGRYVTTRAADVAHPDDLVAACRDWYPEIRVRIRSDLAQLTPGEVWYVYRDGGVRRRNPDNWWTHPEAARVRFGRNAVFIDANDAAMTLVGGDLAGRSLSDVRPPEQEADPDWLWQSIESAGPVSSVARLQTLDGAELPIEFRADRSEERGVYVSWWRQIGPSGE
jgi:hypothetical protein